MPTAVLPDASAAGDVALNVASFARHLRAENKAPLTIVTYRKAVHQLDRFLAEAGMLERVADIRREHLEAFLIDLQERGHRPATVAQRFRSLQQFFKWRDACAGTVAEIVRCRARPHRGLQFTPGWGRSARQPSER